MKMFLGNNEVNEVELKSVFDTLDYGPPDGGTFEIIVLSDIDEKGNIYFDIERYSAF
jgi:hypothetical protein